MLDCAAVVVFNTDLAHYYSNTVKQALRFISVFAMLSVSYSFDLL